MPKDMRDRKEWILVDDAADVVRVVLQWCGLDTEWEIENTGVRLKDKMVFNRGQFLIDIIKAMSEMTNYVFYMKPPSQFDADDLSPENENNLSPGIPVFRENQAMRQAAQTLEPIETVNEDDLLTGIQAHLTDEPLAQNIRVRGKRLKKKKGGRGDGGEPTRRYMYHYMPPWARRPNFPQSPTPEEWSNANVKKYVVHHDELLDSFEECKIACLIIAFREALESAQATCEFPGFSPIHLDHQISVRDTGTGLSTRLWLSNRQLSIRTGENAHFKMAVGGSLIDLPDITEVREELVHAIADEGYNPGLNHIEYDRWHWIYFGRPQDKPDA